jgi:hypothetical protein
MQGGKIMTSRIPGRKTHLIKDGKNTACGLNYWQDDIDADSDIKKVDCKKCLKTK